MHGVLVASSIAPEVTERKGYFRVSELHLCWVTLGVLDCVQ